MFSLCAFQFKILPLYSTICGGCRLSVRCAVAVSEKFAPKQHGIGSSRNFLCQHSSQSVGLGTWNRRLTDWKVQTGMRRLNESSLFDDCLLKNFFQENCLLSLSLFLKWVIILEKERELQSSILDGWPVPICTLSLSKWTKGTLKSCCCYLRFFHIKKR